MRIIVCLWWRSYGKEKQPAIPCSVCASVVIYQFNVDLMSACPPLRYQCSTTSAHACTFFASGDHISGRNSVVFVAVFVLFPLVPLLPAVVILMRSQRSFLENGCLLSFPLRFSRQLLTSAFFGTGVHRSWVACVSGYHVLPSRSPRRSIFLISSSEGCYTTLLLLLVSLP